ncbi:hypothetical protein LPA06_10690 [Lacticaseibacillus paracasei subsp. tolerans]|nr:hypothetical protein LPA06_10690 [Lacticaseibacillus paracasei subsp. tolerans]
MPTKKVLIALMYNHFDGTFALRYADTGIIIPFTSMKPVDNHCTVAVEMLKAFISVGNAVDRMV